MVIKMIGKEITGIEAIIFWFTFLLFTLPHLPYKKLLIEWWYRND